MDGIKEQEKADLFYNTVMEKVKEFSEDKENLMWETRYNTLNDLADAVQDVISSLEEEDKED